MKNPHETSQHTAVASQQTVADHGDVNVIPYDPATGCTAAQNRSRQLSPMPQVPPLTR